MANIASFAENLMLNFVSNTQTATRPTNWGIGLSLGVPTSVSGSEITTGSGYARASGSFGAAAGGSLVNTVAVTYGPFSGAASITGIAIYDTVLSLGSGNLLWYGTLTTARTVGVGDSLVIASGALTISLS